LGAELHQRPHAARGALLQFDWLRKARGAQALRTPELLRKQGLAGMAELRTPPVPGRARGRKATALAQFTSLVKCARRRP
jgi:hypothetical protein